jgi:curli biogenesis system outer membrane secretion channel CsgG
VGGAHTVQSAANAGKYVADSVSSHMLQMDCFEVLERSRISQLLQEKELTQTDVVKRGIYKEVGQFLGVEYLVLGTVNTYTTWARGEFHGHIVSFNSRCVDVRSGKVVWTLGGKVEAGPFGPIDPARGLARILDDAAPKLQRGLKARQP